MSKSTPNISAFISGELSPKLMGRTDLQRYYSACSDITNMVVMPQGGLTKRPGTVFVQTTYSSSYPSTLVPFIYSQDVAYILEFNQYAIRVFSDGAVVTSITSPYTAADAEEMHYVQQGDILYITHQDHPPRQLMRFTNNQWGIAAIDFKDGPYLDQNVSDVEISQSVAETGVSFNVNGIATNLVTYDVAGGKKGKFNSCANVNTTWTDRTVAGTKTVNRIRWVAYSIGKFIAVGDRGFLAESSLGVTWTVRAAPTSATLNIYDVVYDGAKYIFVGQTGLIRYGWDLTSAAWTSATSPATVDWKGIALGNDLLVVVGEQGKIAYSTDGITWTLATTGVTIDFNGVSYIEGVGFVAVGNSGMIFYSSDGITWIAAVSNVSVNLREVFATPTTFYAVGDQGFVLSSTNRVTWTIQNLSRSIDWLSGVYSLKYGVGTILIGGKDGIVARSTDGITWSIQNMRTVTFQSTDALFTSDDVGRKFRWQKEGSEDDWGWGNILSVVSPVDIICDVRSKFGTTADSTVWRLGTFYIGNYPKCIEFYEQRLFLANTPDSPTGIWASASGDYTNFRPSSLAGTVVDSDGLSYSLPVSEEIKWLKSANILLIGFGNGIGRLSGSGMEEPITPTNILFKVQCANGASDIRPILVGSSVIFVERLERKVRKLDYNETLAVWEASDLIIMSEHLASAGIVSMAFQQMPFGILWFVLSDETMIGCTYEKDHQVVAWHKHTIGGGDISGNIAVIPTSDGEDQLWMICRRGGMIEIVAYMRPFDFGALPGTEYFTDVTESYTSKFTTVDLATPGKLKRIQSAMVRLFKTGYAKLGYSSAKADVVKAIDTPLTLYTGDKHINFPSGPERTCQVYMENAEDAPFTVLSITPDIEI